MRAWFVMLVAAIVAACGSSSKTAAKAPEPPAAAAPAPAPEPEAPAAKPHVEQDGNTLKFNILGFQLTMSDAEWKGQLAREENGSVRVVLFRPELEALLVIIPVRAQGESAKSIAESQHGAATKEPGLAVSPVADEGKGRYAFTADRMIDGEQARTYLAVSPHPSFPGAYLIAVGQVAVDKADAFLAEVRTALDSLAALP